jgi:hypothetical protein
MNPPRTVINFNTDWRYRQGEITGAERADYADGSWAFVDLPNNTKFNTPEDVSEYLGVSWYRKHFNTEPAWDGGRIEIRFEGIMQRAEVWVNDVLATTHFGGYTPFVVDVTDMLMTSDTNVIAVKADSRPGPQWAPGKTGVDFRYFGGIYRDVTMTVTGRVHITDSNAADHIAGGGLFITTSEVEHDSALVRVLTEVANESSEARTIDVEVNLYGPDGRLVSSGAERIGIEAHGRTTVRHDLRIDRPELWHPDHPWLYEAEVSVMLDGALVDKVSDRFGVRRIHWSHDGLFINGERFRAIGVNKHQEIYGLGNALPVGGIRLDVKRVKDAGFDFIRTSHYPNHPAFYSACDEFGVLVLNSMTGWQTYYDTPAFLDNTGKELRMMIRRDRNHPSIIAWETSLNETEYPAEWARTMHSIAHEEFPGDQMFTAGWKDHFDIFLGASQHGVRETANPKPIIISEWGDWDHGGNSSSSRVPRESYDLPWVAGNNLQQVANHQDGLNANLSMPWFAADGLWDFADMSGYNPDASLMGVVDYYRIPKFSYHFFRSQRDPAVRIPCVSTGPMVFIANTWSCDSPRHVMVFSNAERVRLYKNDHLIAERLPDAGPGTFALPHPPFTFDAGPFEEGTLRAEALIDDSVVASNERSTAKAPAAVRLRPEDDQALKADGSDARLIFIDVVDKGGTVVYTNTSSVDLLIEGPGSIVGPTSLRMKGGQLAVWVRARRSPGTITLTASSPGLTAARASIEVHAVPGLPDPPHGGAAMPTEDIVPGAEASASSADRATRLLRLWTGSGHRRGGQRLDSTMPGWGWTSGLARCSPARA